MKGHLPVSKSTLFVANYSYGLSTALSTGCTSWFNQYLDWYTDRKTVYGSAVKCHSPWVLENVRWWRIYQEAHGFPDVAGKTPEGANGHEGIQLLCVLSCGHLWPFWDQCKSKSSSGFASPGRRAESLRMRVAELQQLCLPLGFSSSPGTFNPNKIPSFAAQALGLCVWGNDWPMRTELFCNKGIKIGEKILL